MRCRKKVERMKVRTDLALEARESFDGSDTEVHGGVVEEEYEEADVVDKVYATLKEVAERRQRT